jgi:hypothetical protein
MLVCRACNTRYENGRPACPSCGRRSSRNAAESGDSGPLPPSSPLDSGEIDLDDEVGEERARAKASARPAARSPSPDASGSERVPSPGASGSARLRSPDASGSARVPAADRAADVEATADQVKRMLSEQPGLLETGLGLHANDDGDPVGVDFGTPVGSIDLLARDRKGGFVVVHIPAPDEVADSVSAMLRRMGWVRKHLSDGNGDVRGVVILDQLPEDLVYAAAGAGGSISFKSCRLSLSFHDLDA